MIEVNKIYNMDCVEGMKLLDDNSVDSIVTDPPYGLGFMGKAWDNFRDSKTNESPVYKKGLLKTQGKSRAPWLTDKFREENVNFQKFCEEWARQCLRVLKPGGHLLAFGGTRTYHRMACAIEDAGFEIRDQMQWIYGSGFPKSHNISKAIDKKAGVEREIIGTYQHPDGKPRNIDNHKANKDARIADQEWGMKQSGFQPITAPATSEVQQWDGWGTALKPANEPIVVARKPLSEKTIADNVLKWGTGGINIDDCRVKYDMSDTNPATNPLYRKENGYKTNYGIDSNPSAYALKKEEGTMNINNQGRFPANVILDEEAGKMLDEQSGESKSKKSMRGVGYTDSNIYGTGNKDFDTERGYNDVGGASRFFYCAKANKKERGEGNNHPTVKPLSLIKYLITLVTQPNGICLDPFEGSGTHALACNELGFNYIGFELDDKYYEIAKNRINQHIIDNKLQDKYELII